MHVGHGELLRRVWILALGLACSAAPDGTTELASATQLRQSASVGTELADAVEEAQAPRCGLALDPIPELLVATTTVAARWSAATGCDVRVEAGGLPVRFATDAELTTGEGKAARGVAHRNGSGVVEYIGYTSNDARLPWTVERTVAHEVGHALGCWDHTDEAGASVLDQTWSSDARITSDALDCVCSTLECETLTPEG